ncbi:MAG: hypothetical protein IPP44_24930 [Ideonella sp.]|nr:hypothetical protein [Ideonella sp.]
MALPLFAAARIDAAMCTKLRTLTNLCVTHQLLEIQFWNGVPPIYWDVKVIDGNAPILEEFTVWIVTEDWVQVEFWGRQRLSDGSHGQIEKVAQSAFMFVSALEQMRSQGTLFDISDFGDDDDDDDDDDDGIGDSDGGSGGDGMDADLAPKGDDDNSHISKFFSRVYERLVELRLWPAEYGQP